MILDIISFFELETVIEFHVLECTNRYRYHQSVNHLLHYSGIAFVYAEQTPNSCFFEMLSGRARLEMFFAFLSGASPFQKVRSRLVLTSPKVSVTRFNEGCDDSVVQHLSI